MHSVLRKLKTIPLLFCFIYIYNIFFLLIITYYLKKKKNLLPLQSTLLQSSTTVKTFKSIRCIAISIRTLSLRIRCNQTWKKLKRSQQRQPKKLISSILIDDLSVQLIRSYQPEPSIATIKRSSRSSPEWFLETSA